MRKLVDLFCHVDDFYQAFLPQWKKLQIENSERKRNRKGRMPESEIMTIIIAFHMYHHRDFKNFYLGLICQSKTQRRRIELQKKLLTKFVAKEL
ncbi:hypothetical protein [Vibrio amylolyticus]|uniref:hypothetical protein n=1 Tax=Vibrio amylolyticus TaxID=2847292 RepID=UPI003555D62B